MNTSIKLSMSNLHAIVLNSSNSRKDNKKYDSSEYSEYKKDYFSIL